MKGRALKRLRDALLILLLLLLPGGGLAADKVIGVLLTCDLPRYREAHKAFVKALAVKGYDQGKVEIVTQTPNPDPISWANSVRKFNAIGADLIVTYGAPATIVALKESDLPVVFADVYGPVETGIAKNMQSAGKNVTGVSSKIPLVTLVKTASDLKPLRSIGVIYTVREEGSLVQLREMTRIATQLGVAITAVNVTTPASMEQGLATLFAAKVDYIYVSECTAASRGFDKIVHRAGEQKIPVLTLMPGGGQRGALVSMEVDPAEQGHDAADFAARILSGKKASQLPVATPKKVELIVNLRIAKSLDLQVPFPVLAAATKVLK